MSVAKLKEWNRYFQKKEEEEINIFKRKGKQEQQNEKSDKHKPKKLQKIKNLQRKSNKQ